MGMIAASLHSAARSEPLWLVVAATRRSKSALDNLAGCPLRRCLSSALRVSASGIGMYMRLTNLRLQQRTDSLE